jgi:spermidine synthase
MGSRSSRQPPLQAFKRWMAEAYLRDSGIVLRPGEDGVHLVPDRAHRRAYTLRVGRADQSYVDLDDPLRLEFDYLQRLADLIDCAAEPGKRLRVVHVGGAAMSLPRYVAATRPWSAQLVLEPDAELTAFIRAYLPLPQRSGIKVRAVDGRSGITALREGQADLVIIDAFVGTRVPAELTTAEYFADVCRVLSPTGTMMINLTDRGPLSYARRVLAGLTSSFTHRLLCAEPSTLKGRRFGNVILAGSSAALPVSKVADRAGRPPYPYRVVHGARLDQLVAKAAPFTDADAQWSPEPPRGWLDH